MKKAEKFSEQDKAYMKIALDLSRRGLGTVFPNPSVGCVLVRDGHIIGRGWTGAGGRPHAEKNALKFAGNAENSTAYVTLEPCSHYGKTPPCAQALINANVAKVIVATSDPDPRVSGKGIRMLKDAGIQVEFGLLQEEADYINQGFFQKIKENRPLITVKIASTKDGKIAKVEGEQYWVTGPLSRKRGHLYRATHDAIMVGIGTVISDDPMLNCRINGLENRSPIRVVLDSQLRINPQSKLCKSAMDIPLWIMTTVSNSEKYTELEKLGAKIFCINKDKIGQVNIDQVMEVLSDEGITRILSEGGAKLNASLIRASLVDRLLWFKSEDSIGETGVDALYDIPIENLGKYLNLSLVDEGETPPDHWQEFRIKR
ncbi:MAG: bifunctional diaminohydroxyphosphoribosylaminopyrimidine deaminase/5-amino-6-(5-phosphoribosylamino)uracil reductase RibD [Alphaproteobacteria bacterium]|nr:bifunctional diaminohydroxyphosphoribosylaminopyrimidine deaminase/5-amino-6-(5-phosphoribosylamino)uracil reductase RibD [Alphaproteobacteria bacterium]HPF46416.1 bifunctional diaminohydroxyphosphoribosylaminopyrimidine deaminase/5-amino-6-(5-phosphoribosylamino)uracil reductase RibD [Emcibacteraceae bacterium]